MTAGRTLRVLLVEDHDWQRMALRNLLQGMGIVGALEAADGARALELLATAEPPVDIVISDIDMPGMDGLEFLRRIGESPRLPAIILSSAVDSAVLASVGNVARAYGIELLGALAKPVRANDIESLFQRHLARTGKALTAPAFQPSLEQIDQGLDNNEFEPFFQPKIDLVSGRLCGFEALARWRLPSGAVVSPLAFIAPMEVHGRIDALTLSLLARSAACCRQWREQGAEVTVSVNLSATSLHDFRFVDRLVQTVASQGLAPAGLLFELTESAAADQGPVLESLTRLRIKGFGLSIDDFGTGYASFQQLQRSAFTELKIDRSFVRDAGHTESARMILQSCVDLARELNIVSVAEGVETEQEWHLARTLGCNLAQGYLIAPPMASHAVRDWLPRRSVGPRP